MAPLEPSDHRKIDPSFKEQELRHPLTPSTTLRMPQGLGTMYQYPWTRLRDPERPTEGGGLTRRRRPLTASPEKRREPVSPVERKDTSPESVERRPMRIGQPRSSQRTTSGSNTIRSKTWNYKRCEHSRSPLTTYWTTHSRCSTGSQTPRRTPSYTSTREEGRIFPMPN